jgi:hypothetical protein
VVEERGFHLVLVQLGARLQSGRPGPHGGDVGGGRDGVGVGHALNLGEGRRGGEESAAAARAAPTTTAALASASVLITLASTSTPCSTEPSTSAGPRPRAASAASRPGGSAASSSATLPRVIASGHAQYVDEKMPAGRWLPLFFRPPKGSLLDEPTVGLDTASLERFVKVMAKQLDDGGMIIAAVHDPLPIAARACDLSGAMGPSV